MSVETTSHSKVVAVPLMNGGLSYDVLNTVVVYKFKNIARQSLKNVGLGYVARRNFLPSRLPLLLDVFEAFLLQAIL
jgi:hypothetical protein